MRKWDVIVLAHSKWRKVSQLIPAGTMPGCRALEVFQGMIRDRPLDVQSCEARPELLFRPPGLVSALLVAFAPFVEGTADVG